ncbi:MAG: hypothetical protein PVI86_04280 [Phycisphaerae bacterium]
MSGTSRIEVVRKGGSLQLSAVSLALSAIALTLGGCASTGASPLSYGLRRIEGGDRAAVFEVAETVLVDLGFRIDRVDGSAGLISTHPAWESQRSDGSMPRISSRDRLRRVVEVRVEDRAETVNVYCKVLIQEQVTGAHRMFAYERSGTDLPGETPIEREAATTEEQNAVWQTIRRDKGAERRILEAIVLEIRN